MATSRYDYSSIAETAINLIYRFGAEFKHKTPDTSFIKTYSAEVGGYVWADGTDTYTEQPWSTETADGVITDYSQEERTDTSIELGDKKLLTVEITAPSLGDVFTIGTTDYSCINYDTIQPASTTDPLLYKIQLRV